MVSLWLTVAVFVLLFVSTNHHNSSRIVLTVLITAYFMTSV